MCLCVCVRACVRVCVCVCVAHCTLTLLLQIITRLICYWHCPCRRSMRSRVYETVQCPSVCPSVCPSLCAHSNNPAATGLLLWARRAEDNIGRLLGQHLSAGECGQSHVVSVRRKLFTDLLTCLVIVFCYPNVLRTVSFWQ